MRTPSLIATAVIVGIVGAIAPAAAQAPDQTFIGSSDNPSVAEFRPTTLPLLGRDAVGIGDIQHRRNYDGSVFYGVPLNFDFGGTRGPHSCRVPSWPNDMNCHVQFEWTNTTDEPVTEVAVGFTGLGLSATSDLGSPIEPGEAGIVAVELVPNPTPGSYEGRLVLLANGEVATFEMAFDVLGTAPSYPMSVNHVFSDDALSVYWSPPAFDGGSPITGYLVELIRPDQEPGTHPTASFEWWDERVVACDFRGQPELTQCDLPNAQSPLIESGTWLVAVQALTDLDPDPASHVDVFFTAEMLLSTLGEEPSPAVEDSSPADEVVAQLDTYDDAPNIASVVEAVDYDNKLDAPVLRLYQAYFNRPPDLGGAKYWLALRREGYDLGDIAGFMSESDEFHRTYAGTTNPEYVERVYRNVLGRDVDRVGYEYWLGLLENGDLTRAGAVFYISGNDEFIDSYPFTNGRAEPA